MDNNMTEKEMLIAAMTSSHGVMQEIEAKEDEYLKLKEKLDKASRVLYVVLIIILGFFVGMSTSRIVGEFLSIVLCAATIAVLLMLRSTSINGIKKKMQKVANELGQLKSDSTLNWLPMDYRHSLAYNAITSYVINMRANTLQEAINLFETELHQARVEMYTARNNQ